MGFEFPLCILGQTATYWALTVLLFVVLFWLINIGIILQGWGQNVNRKCKNIIFCFVYLFIYIAMPATLCLHETKLKTQNKGKMWHRCECYPYWDKLLEHLPFRRHLFFFFFISTVLIFIFFFFIVVWGWPKRFRASMCIQRKETLHQLLQKRGRRLMKATRIGAPP